jgi:hypothetical protein
LRRLASICFWDAINISFGQAELRYSLIARRQTGRGTGGLEVTENGEKNAGRFL